MDVVVEALTRYGLPGAIIALIAVLYVLKDRELRSVREAKDQELKVERDARINDSKEYRELALKLQAQVIDTVNTLRTVFDEVRRLPAQR